MGISISLRHSQSVNKCRQMSTSAGDSREQSVDKNSSIVSTQLSTEQHSELSTHQRTAKQHAPLSLCYLLCVLAATRFNTHRPDTFPDMGSFLH